MLTVSDFLDLIAGHTICDCLSGIPTSDCSDRCPRQSVVRGHGSAQPASNPAQQPELALIPQTLFPLDRIPDYLSGWDVDTPRVVISILLWRITAEYVQDSEPLTIQPAHSIAETAEQYIRDHWQDAEAEQPARPGPLISRYLDDIGLLEDYIRVKQNRQHMAFVPGPGLNLAWTLRRFTTVPGALSSSTPAITQRAADSEKRVRQVRSHLTAGLDVLDEDGRPDGTSVGEWHLTWVENDEGHANIELTAPLHSWHALHQTRFVDLVAELAGSDSTTQVPAEAQVVKALIAAGWVRSTESASTPDLTASTRGGRR
ncbi:hypothetical protein ACFV9C_42710 [Kribbella sp. NPDC059898]|uniref:hypothetical protein n=1 Tax=Kribbella sp. NPDC059898 TaxID=3346995 RepID=UPI00365F682A